VRFLIGPLHFWFSGENITCLSSPPRMMSYSPIVPWFYHAKIFYEGQKWWLSFKWNDVPLPVDSSLFGTASSLNSEQAHSVQIFNSYSSDHKVIFKVTFLTGCDAMQSIKGKSVPLRVWIGPEGSTKLRIPDFMKTAQDGGKVVSLTHRPPLPPVNTHGTRFC